MKLLLRLLTTVSVGCMGSLCMLASDSEFTPTLTISGQLKARAEMSTVQNEEVRFQIRNARLRAAGNVSPSISYRAELDLCDRGTTKVTDVWGLSSSGQNIYPEEIEAKLNNMPYVAESLVVERGHKLVALVYPDYEATDAARLTNEMLPRVMEQIRKDLNKQVAPYEQIDEIQLRPTEFEKTPKRSIKRFLYK